MEKKILELIKLVNERYDHIRQLETLEQILEETGKYDAELIVLKTTHNSHSEYRYMGLRRYQNPLNHIDQFIDILAYNQDGYTCALDNTELAPIENSEEMNWEK